MAKVHSKNTKPEIRLRKLIWSLGCRGYRIHYAGLPGKPDIAFTRRKKAIFMHGCFWHGHDCPAGRKTPTSNLDYWQPKRERNKQRDADRMEAIRNLGWSIQIIWECELKDQKSVAKRLESFLCASSI